MEFIKAFAMFLSLVMCIFLFAYSYMEGIRISNEEGKVRATTFLFSLVTACIFGFTAHSLYFS
jgi:hypothetical protein